MNFGRIGEAEHGTFSPVDVRTVDSLAPFRAPPTLAAWRRRAAALRRRILLAAGIGPGAPAPGGPPRSRSFGRLEREGYAIEKIVFEAAPGLWVGANLWRPAAGERRARPAVLHPHGHWDDGRTADDPDGSTIAFASTLARRGFLVLAWDMLGYGDARQIPHAFRSRLAEEAGITVLGLQLRAAIRALDLALSLPEVDPRRVAVAGASGGATQSLLLAAVDRRVAASVLVGMVSSEFQGGCFCENAPGLRVDTSNVEFAALAAPRPQLLVSASGDWTRRTPRRELPAIRSAYRLFGRAASGRLENAHFRLPHGFFRPMREAVYDFLERRLGGARHGAGGRPPAPREGPYRRERPRDLLAFSGGRGPPRFLRGRALLGPLLSAQRRALRAAGVAALARALGDLRAMGAAERLPTRSALRALRADHLRALAGCPRKLARWLGLRGPFPMPPPLVERYFATYNRAAAPLSGFAHAIAAEIARRGDGKRCGARSQARGSHRPPPVLRCSRRRRGA